MEERASDMDIGPLTSDSFEFALGVGVMMIAAEAVLRGAFQRTESRGVHYWTDYPDVESGWQRNIYTEAR